MDKPAVHRSVMGRIGRIAGWTVGSIVVVPLALVTLVFLALTVRPIRNFAVKKGVEYANSVMGGYTVAVKSVDRIDPWGLNARGIQLFDDKKRELVNAPWVLVRLKPWPLIHNTLRLTRVEIDGVRAHLYPADPNKPPEPEEPPSKPSTFVVRAEHVRIRDAQAVMDYDDRTLTAVVGTLAVGGVYGPKPALAIKEASIRVDADEVMLLRLHTTKGTWSAEKGGQVGIAAQVVDAPLTLAADLPALDQMEPWPIKTVSLQLSNVNRRTVKLLGVKDGAGMQTSVGLTLAAKAQGEKLSANLKLQTGKHGIVSIGASADDKVYDLSLAILPTQLAAIATLLPNLKVQGNLLAHATHGEDRMPRKVDLRWDNVAVNDGAFPDGALRGELALPIVRIASVKLEGLEDRFAVQAEYDTKRSRGKGAIQFHELRLQSVELLEKQGLAGLLDGGLEANLAASTINADGKLMVRDFKHPSAQLGSLDLGLAVSGTLVAPVGHFNLAIERLAAGKVKLDKMTAELLATPKTLSAKIAAVGPDTNMKLELGGQRGSDSSLRVQGIGRGVIAKKELRFDLRELHYAEQSLSVQELALFTGKQSVVLNGKLDAQDRIDALITLTSIDLTEWASYGNVAGLEGKLGGTAKIGGTTSEPNVDSTLKLEQVKYKSDLPLDGTIALKGDLATRKAALKVGVYSSDELGARIEAAVAIPKRPVDLSKAILGARLNLKASVFMPVGQISAIAGDQLAGLDGMLEAHVTADGTLEAPKLDADISARLKLPEQKGDPVEALRVTAKIDKDQGKVSFYGKDEVGELLSFDGYLAWPGGNPRAALARPTAWRETKFELRADLQPRRLDTMQGVFAYFTKIYAISLPVSASAKVKFEGDHGTLGGTAAFRATIYGDKLDGRCRLGTTSAVDLDLELREDHLDAKMGAKTDGGGAITGTISSVLALNALNGKDPVFGPAKVSLKGQDIAIHKLPGLCNLQSGSASFDADISGLGKQKPKLDLTASIDNLSAPMTESVNVGLRAQVAEFKADLSINLKSKTRQVGYIEAHLPLTYAAGSTTPTVAPDAALQGKVQLDKLPLANVLSFTEAFGRIGGSASANLALGGKLNDPYPEGHVELKDVNLSLAALAQPFRGVNAYLDIKGRSLNLRKLTARDRDGKLSLQGFANLNKDMSGTGGLYIEADRFPLRQQGTIIGELTIRARADAKIPADLKAQAQLKILDGRIWLTGERGKSVQTLDAHPDISFADEKTDSDTEAEAQAEGHPGVVLGLFTIKTEQPLWLEHQDFSLQVGVDVKLAQDDSGAPTLLGQAELVRGDLKLLGKVFKLKNGVIRFTGDMPPDPELDIKATFKPPAGPDLIVSVSGRGSSPIIDFSGAATNASEAVALLTGKSQQSQNSANSDATSQMASIASNMTAGLLVMSARRKFGDWVPMISVQTGPGGTPSGATAGFDASKLIPPWAEGFARSAYVEGMIGSGGQAGGSSSTGGVGLGVKLEVALPHDFVTDLGYGPGSSWSTDVAWSP
ncbi:MAG: hypothetical protein JWN48_4312 [Myxococcaceae bacterium]|nr:hypothetical protein [Myxococcaceae bacterium]